MYDVLFISSDYYEYIVSDCINNKKNVNIFIKIDTRLFSKDYA